LRRAEEHTCSGSLLCVRQGKERSPGNGPLLEEATSENQMKLTIP
jgi:hypothetical protein